MESCDGELGLLAAAVGRHPQLYSLSHGILPLAQKHSISASELRSEHIQDSAVNVITIPRSLGEHKSPTAFIINTATLKILLPQFFIFRVSGMCSISH